MTFDISQLRQNKLFNIYLFFFFALITLILYSESINNFFVLDDFIFLKAASQGSLSANFHFFPVPLIIYRIFYLIWGLTPVPIRIFNILINSINCVLVYKLSFKIFSNFGEKKNENDNSKKAIVCSLLFAVHYIHV